MKVTVLKPNGYCSGVEHAINLAIQTRKKHPKENVVVLGMLVHNEESLKKLEQHGIKTIYKKGFSLEELIKLIDKPSVVILTAHGHCKKIEDLLIKNNHKIVDATCPFVSNSFKQIKEELNNGNTVFYIGIKNHPESNAAISLGEKVIFVDAKEPKINIENIKLSKIISQTTLSDSEVSLAIRAIQNDYPEAEFIHGICNASTERQNALKNIPPDADAIFVVGGLNSNNSKTLYNIALSLYPNLKIKLIENVDQIKEKDLIGLNHLVISSGASTPKDVIEKIVSKLSD